MNFVRYGRIKKTINDISKKFNLHPDKKCTNERILLEFMKNVNTENRFINQI